VHSSRPYLYSRPDRDALASQLRTRFEAGSPIPALIDDTGLTHGTVCRLLIEAGAVLPPGEDADAADGED
jgi:hypothetical protein